MPATAPRTESAKAAPAGASTTQSDEKTAAEKRGRQRLVAAACIQELLTAELVPLDFILPGLLRGTVGALIGPGGVGKSFWAMQLAISIASGVDLVGLKPKRGKVLYLSGEDPEQIHAQRLRAMTAGAPGNLDISATFDLRIVRDQHVDVMDDGWLEELAAAAKGRDLVILDTLTRFHNLDENSALDMKRLLARLELLASLSGAAVVFLHHTSKAAATAGLGGAQQAARGSSVLVDNARWACFLAAMTPDEARRRGFNDIQREACVRWNISKQNYGSAIPDVWYQRSASGVLHPQVAEPGKPALFPELVDESKDKGRRGGHINFPSRRTKQAINSADPTGLLARGIHANSSLTERNAHAKAMAASAERVPPSATNAYNNNW